MAILDDADGAETRESPRDASDAVVVDAMREGATPTARGGADARDDDGDDDETSTRKLLPNDRDDDERRDDDDDARARGG